VLAATLLGVALIVLDRAIRSLPRFPPGGAPAVSATGRR
jgi:hypothetical protein